MKANRNHYEQAISTITKEISENPFREEVYYQEQIVDLIYSTNNPKVLKNLCKMVKEYIEYYS